MTNRTNAIAPATARSVLVLPGFIALVILFSLFLLVGLLLAHHALRMDRSGAAYNRSHFGISTVVRFMSFRAGSILLLTAPPRSFDELIPECRFVMFPAGFYDLDFVFLRQEVDVDCG